MAVDVEIGISTNTKQARKAINTFAKEAQRSLKSVRSDFNALKSAAAGAVAFLGARALINQFKELTAAAAAQEDAINSLNSQLRLAGDFSEEASQDFQDFASELQAVSVVGDETTLQLLALSKTFGVTNEQAKDLTTAAVELAASTGISLDSAVRNLGKTFSGLTGELGESIPALRALTKEQLQAGAAVELVLNRFRGAALAQIQTFSGAVTQLGNAWGDLREAIGAVIVENPEVIKLLNSLSFVVQTLTASIKTNDEAAKSLVSTYAVGLQSAILPTIKFIQDLIVSFQALEVANIKLDRQIAEVAKGLLNFNPVTIIVRAAIGSVRDFVNLLTTALVNLLDLLRRIPAASAVFDTLGIDLDRLRQKLIDFDRATGELLKDPFKTADRDLKNFIDRLKAEEEAALSLLNNLRDEFRTINEAFTEGLDEIAKSKPQVAVDITGPAISDGKLDLEVDGKEIEKAATTGQVDFFTNLRNKSREAIKELFDGIGISTSGLGFDRIISELVLRNREFLETIANSAVNTGINFAQNFVNGLGRGADGARDAVVSLASDITDTLGLAFAGIPGLGQAARPVFDLLAQGREQTKAQVEAFIKELPKIINAIVDAIPVLVQTIAENSDIIIKTLVESSPRIAAALTFGVAEGLIKALPTVAQKFIDNFIVAFAQVTNFIRTAGSQATKEAFQSFKNAFIGGIGAIVGRFFEQFGIAFRETAGNILQGLVTIFTDLGGVIAQILEDTFVQAVQTLLDGIRDGIGDLNPVSAATGGGGKGPITGISGSPIATGGTIPAGFPNDTFPARLTSGEVVVPKDDVLMLRDFLESQSSGGTDQTAILGQILAALNRPQTASASVNFDSDVLADVIFKLNRRNARLA